jgi:hypothetical protein
MPLHSKLSIRENLEDELYSSADLSVTVPKYKFPETEQDPRHANTVGCSTTGSSEAAMLGGMAMKRAWEAKRKAAGKPSDKPNLVTGPVQICWHKR